MISIITCSPCTPTPRVNTGVLTRRTGGGAVTLRAILKPECWKKCGRKEKRANRDASSPVETQEPPCKLSKLEHKSQQLLPVCCFVSFSSVPACLLPVCCLSYVYLSLLFTKRGKNRTLYFSTCFIYYQEDSTMFLVKFTLLRNLVLPSVCLQHVLCLCLSSLSRISVCVHVTVCQNCPFLIDVDRCDSKTSYFLP